VHAIYKFLHSSNPIDLITAIFNIESIFLKKNSENLPEFSNVKHCNSNFKIVYKQIMLKEDLLYLEDFLEQMSGVSAETLLQDPCQTHLHFPVVLPTYAFFNDNYKECLEKEYKQIINCLSSESLAKLFSAENRILDPYDSISTARSDPDFDNNCEETVDSLTFISKEIFYNLKSKKHG
jgi:hypothetical protein